MDEQHLRELLAQRPRGLMTDIDGTIAPIAPTPDAAQVSPVARAQLQRLAQHFDVVAAISGRAPGTAAAMIGLPELTYIGNHGFEVWKDGLAEPVPEAQPYVASIGAAIRAAQAEITLPGVIFEDKHVTATVHYRQVADPAQATELIGAVLRRLAAVHGLRLTQGQMVWELRPPLDINKGTAARALVQHYGLRSAIFLGDDRTDADVFTALRELRGTDADRPSIMTLGVGVLGAETPLIVREQADLLVDGVPGVERLLSTIAAIVAST